MFEYFSKLTFKISIVYIYCRYNNHYLIFYFYTNEFYKCAQIKLLFAIRKTKHVIEISYVMCYSIYHHTLLTFKTCQHILKNWVFVYDFILVVKFVVHSILIIVLYDLLVAKWF